VNMIDLSDECMVTGPHGQYVKAHKVIAFNGMPAAYGDKVVVDFKHNGRSTSRLILTKADALQLSHMLAEVAATL